MTYTVKKMADLAGITVRTLHFYDESGLLKPSINSDNGYRYYEEKDVMRLQQILFFRELEFPLEQIREIIDSPVYDSQKALFEQREMLRLKRDRLDNILNTIDDVIEGREAGVGMSDDQRLGSFSKKQVEEYKEEAKKRWGDSNLWKQSQVRTKHWTDKDYKKIIEKGEKWTKKLTLLSDNGYKVDSVEVQEMIALHYEGLKVFYEPNLEMYRGLSQIYVDDPRFAAYYERFSKGLSIFLRDAMIVFVERQTK